MNEKIEVNGSCRMAFAAVRETFAANFTEGKEVGSSFAVVHEGEVVVDLWAGFADAARTRPWQSDTLINTFSTTKGMVATVVGVLADEGLIDYTAKVADYWPEFAAAGKQDITIAQLLSHQAGICGPRERTEMEALYDWDALCAVLAAQWPFWQPGTANGYHALVFGHIAGEVARRAYAIQHGVSKSLGELFAEKVAAPLGADTDFYIGLPGSEEHRVAEMIPAIDAVQLGAGVDGERVSDVVHAALANPQINVDVVNKKAWRAAEVPGGNGQGNGRGIAKIYGALANGGEFEGRSIISRRGVDAMSKEECFRKDQVIGVPMRWARGFILNNGELYGPGPNTFGHSGWGGSFGIADTNAKLGMGYAMNQMDANILGDPRAARLIEAVYASL